MELEGFFERNKRLKMTELRGKELGIQYGFRTRDCKRVERMKEEEPLRVGDGV